MSTPSTPRRFSSRPDSATRSKAAGVGRPPAVCDTNSVQDRVRQWQAQGGGVIEAEDVSVKEVKGDETQRKERNSTKERTTRTALDNHANKAIGNITPTKSVGGISTADGDKFKARKPGSAPAKRVVSDGHWRKKKSPPKSAASVKTTGSNGPSGIQPEVGIQSKPMAEPKPERGERRENRRKTPERQSLSPGSLPEGESNVEHTKPGSLNNLDQESKGLPFDKLQRASSSADKGGSRRQRRGLARQEELDDSPQPVRTNHEMGSTRSQKANILSQVFSDSRKLFAKQTLEPDNTPRVPSIEAWLNDTPDPFVDPPEPAMEEKTPLTRPHQRKKGMDKEMMVEDSNQIWESLDTKEGTRRAVSSSTQKRRIPSSAIYQGNPFPSDYPRSGLSESVTDIATASKLVDFNRDSTGGSRTTLKRRAAQKDLSSPVHGRQKSHHPVEVLDENGTAQARSSHSAPLYVEKPDSGTSLKPPRFNNKRPFPSTGDHRLSTIASVETFNSISKSAAAPSISNVSEQTLHAAPIWDEHTAEERSKDYVEPGRLKHSRSRLTKHADLISVLSLPRAENKSIRSARSIRTNRSRIGLATLDDLMQELATDEAKYIRELHTLVDGVIPVLLTCVLSKSDSAVAAGLFQPSSSAREDPNFTRPIVDMGIALERLKTLHRRIPLKSPTALLTWAHGAQRVYSEYMKAWRMGFQDVIVNLAPATESATASTSKPSLDEGLPRDEKGYVINGDGERVDVAFLLKRPLVRLKYLAKTIKGINLAEPSAEAEDLATRYHGLVETARLRANEERARLEDEAAANIDPTRARDPRTLAPLSGVKIDRTRCVRARDHFNLALSHSSGQCIDCRVEFVLRDEATTIGNGGDVLICEVDGTGRWLLFPPIKTSLVSARKGDKIGEIFVMVRGFSSDSSEWRETFSLRSENEQAGFEWVQMLGLTPVPPLTERPRSFVGRNPKRRPVLDESAKDQDQLLSIASTSPNKSRTPSPREVHVPIGEQANDTSKKWAELSHSPGLQQSDEAAADQREPDNAFLGAFPSASTKYVDQMNDLRSSPSKPRGRDIKHTDSMSRPPRSFKEALGLSGTSAMSGLRRTKAKRFSKRLDSSPSTPTSRNSGHDSNSHVSSPESGDAEVKMSGALIDTDTLLSSSPPKFQQDPGSSVHGGRREPKESRSANQRQSPVPSMDIPYIPKARKSSPPVTPTVETVEEPVWSTPPEPKRAQSTTKLSKKRTAPSKANVKNNISPAAMSTHTSLSPVQHDSSRTPVLEQGRQKVRRSSSPLKHEYEPSTASESSFDSDASTVEHNDMESMTESSDEEDPEAGDVPTPLLPIEAIKRISKPPSKTASLPTPEGTLKPSDSASQAPYKAVPSQPNKASKTIASIFSWSDEGSWQSLHPDECSIVITPGLIEAFEMSAAHSSRKPPSASEPILDAEKFAEDASNVTSQNDEVQSERPLIALELTPLVPIRRGTALDISIRSPPTANSQYTASNNIMFRSRNPEECEALYALINHARIHNPTYIALQNARGPFAGSSFPGVTGRRPGSRVTSSRSSWFGGFGRSSSYRASSARTPSIAPSDSSVGSMSSAFSALKRFGRGSGGGMFNIALSTITSRNGTGSGANSVYTSSDNSSGSGTSTPMPPGMVANKDGSLGLKDAKIRLYIRETASRWRDMGSARLTILRAERHQVGPEGGPLNAGTHHQPLHEKRIVVNGKTKGEVLLDAQLGESCFERVARTGIAVSVWEDVVGPNGEVGVAGAVGGVAGGRAKVYMIQVCQHPR